MEKNCIGITQATIHGLSKPVYHLKEKCFWAWNIMFYNHPFFTFGNLAPLYMADNPKDAKNVRNEFLKNFQTLLIHDGDTVGVIYDNDGVIAICSSYHDQWIHVRDKFKVKTYKDLNLKFDSLIITTN